MTKLKDLINIEELIKQTHEEVLDTPLRDFLKEADEIGYSFFCKDIVKKVIIARLNNQGVFKDGSTYKAP